MEWIFIVFYVHFLSQQKKMECIAGNDIQMVEMLYTTQEFCVLSWFLKILPHKQSRPALGEKKSQPP